MVFFNLSMLFLDSHESITLRLINHKYTQQHIVKVHYKSSFSCKTRLKRPFNELRRAEDAERL